MPNHFFSRMTIISTPLFVALASCATVVEHESWQPAKSPAAAELRRVAILPMSGDESGVVRAELESVLASIDYKDGPYFEVVSRGELDRVLNEQALGRSAITDSETAAKVGKILGVEGIYLGVVDQTQFSDQPISESRSRCAQKNKKGGCAAWREYSVSCTKRNANVRLIPKLIAVETAKVVYSKNFSESRTSQGCNDGKGVLQDHVSMERDAVSAALTAFKEDVAPWRQTISITMLDETDGLSTSAAEDQFEGALEFMKAGRSDRACKTFRQLESGGERTPDLLYNLAICNEIEGNVVDALAYCHKADAAVLEPNELINQCLERMQKRTTDQQILLDS